MEHEVPLHNECLDPPLLIDQVKPVFYFFKWSRVVIVFVIFGRPTD